MNTLLLILCSVNKPKPRTTQDPGPNKLYAGESVTFGCKVEESSGWEYEWFKDGSSILQGSSRLVINNATERESGTYHCTATRARTNYRTEESETRTLHISGGW